jgi:uncharacterized protein
MAPGGRPPNGRRKLARPTEFFLDAGAAATGASSGALVDTPPGQRRVIRLVHDPTQPVRSTSSIEEIWYFLAAFPDERVLAARDDVLTFTTESSS